MTSHNSTTSASQFVESVLRLEPRMAAFDCDGTLWGGDAGEGFFDWELRNRLVSDKVVLWARARYKDYKAGRVSEDEMCGEMVTLHRGLREADVYTQPPSFSTPTSHRRFFRRCRN
jgi:hypothetical protein